MEYARDAPLLTDDLDLREAAHSIRATAVGTVGLVFRAVSSKVLTRDEGLAGLDLLLTRSSSFITPNLVARAKAAL